ncbi:MAG TPA: WS/DGAT domain-containing protein, partial [Solirubrobacteraceae bacterium]|nr:WS/DGAT domain-containing protein [Solirubrobacteraceae bacterium]
ARALVQTALPVAPPSTLNEPGSPQRHLATLRRPLSDLRALRRARGATVNDVVLAAVAGALRRHAERRGEAPHDLKSMVPVNVRSDEAGDLGNRISFLFVELPCSLPDPTDRLLTVNRAMRTRKQAGLPEDADAALQVIAHAPRPVQHAAAHVLASPRVYNLVVSNIPGPHLTMFMHGCRLIDAYPVVPLSNRHALSVGMTTIGEHACFGLHADPETLPDADALAGDLDDAIDELLATIDDPTETSPWPTPPGPASTSETRFRPSRSPTPTG